MTQKRRITIAVAIFLIFLSATNVIFFLKLSSDADKTISLQLVVAAVIGAILVPLAFYAGFRYMPKERQIPVFVAIMGGAFLLKTVMPIGSFVSVLALAVAFIVAICAGIFWPGRNNASTESRS